MKNITLEDFYYNYCTINGEKTVRKNRDVQWFKLVQYCRDNNIKIDRFIRERRVDLACLIEFIIESNKKSLRNNK